MGFLDTLTTGTAPTNTQNQISNTQMPAWYQDLIRGISAQGVNAAAQPRQVYPGQQTADFNTDQQNAFSNVRSSQGNWAPMTGGALTSLQGAQSAPGAANAAVAGPAQDWTQNYQKYMSPYTSQVVDEIGRLGARNLNENLLPAVNDQFIGGGGFGSTRNAEIFGRTVRDSNADTLGKQAMALESGYGTASNIFGADANRAQQQGMNQAQTAIQGGQLGNQTAGALSTLGTTTQNLSTNDANNLAGVGALQQGNTQTQLNNQYKDWQDAQGYDWAQLNNLSGLMKNMQVPTSTTSASTSGGTPGSPSPLQWLSYIGAMGQTPQPTTPAPVGQNGAPLSAANPGPTASAMPYYKPGDPEYQYAM
jgi:hypothetical protein